MFTPHARPPKIPTTRAPAIVYLTHCAVVAMPAVARLCGFMRGVSSCCRTPTIVSERNNTLNVHFESDCLNIEMFVFTPLVIVTSGDEVLGKSVLHNVVVLTYFRFV